MPDTKLIISLSFASFLALSTYFILKKSASRKKRKFVGTISHMYLYPIKSGPAITLTQAQCTASGLKYKNLRDRQFVIAGSRSDKSYLTPVKNLNLTHLSITYNESKNCLVLSAADQAPINLDLDEREFNSDLVKPIRFYDGTETSYLDCGDEYAQWFTNLLEEPCRLGYFHPNIHTRTINPDEVIRNGTRHPDTQLLYSASHPYLICCQASLNDINSKISETIGFEQFRPNLVIETGEDVKPFEEDNWRDIFIGHSIIGYNERACVRCARIYVDYNEHRFKPTKEPMTTLLKFRRGEAKKYKSRTTFGMNVSLSHVGSLRLGASVHVTME